MIECSQMKESGPRDLVKLVAAWLETGTKDTRIWVVIVVIASPYLCFGLELSSTPTSSMIWVPCRGTRPRGQRRGRIKEAEIKQNLNDAMGLEVNRLSRGTYDDRHSF